jgi:hypothetical protein
VGTVVLEVPEVPAYGQFTLLASNVRDVSCNANAMTPNQAVVIADQVTAVLPRAPASASRPLLHANVPNPFNPATQLRFSIPLGLAAAPVSLSIHDLRGRQVARLLRGEVMGTGDHSVRWAGSDDSGRPVASGQYIARLEVGGEVLARKITLAK